MLSHKKWGRTGLTTLTVVALLSGSVGWAAKPVKPPPEPEPEPDPPPVTYTITWLDVFDNQAASAINSLGHVVGVASSAGLYADDPYPGGSFAFVYTPETGMVDLNTLLPAGSGWHLRHANDINDFGQVVGAGFRDGDQRWRGFRYTPARLAEDGSQIAAQIEEVFPLSESDQQASAERINEFGEVAGRVTDASGIRHIWFFSVASEGGIVYSEDDGDHPSARGLNKSGQILVTVTPAVAPPQYAVRLSPLGEAEYFYPDYGDIFEVWDMNETGFFVGVSSFEVKINKRRSTYESRAVRHDGKSLVDLGAGFKSCAYGINNYGDVAGRFQPDPYLPSRGFVYLEELQQLVDLDAAVVGDETDLLMWQSSSIANCDINDAGEIAGRAWPLNISFVLTPLP